MRRRDLLRWTTLGAGAAGIPWLLTGHSGAQPDKPTNLQVAHELHCDPDTVARWRNRFARQRLQGLRDLPRSGRPRAFSP